MIDSNPWYIFKYWCIHSYILLRWRKLFRWKIKGTTKEDPIFSHLHKWRSFDIWLGILCDSVCCRRRQKVDIPFACTHSANVFFQLSAAWCSQTLQDHLHQLYICLYVNGICSWWSNSTCLTFCLEKEKTTIFVLFMYNVSNILHIIVSTNKQCGKVLSRMSNKWYNCNNLTFINNTR